jgi:ABC-type multidrug transport system permease subunit
MTDPTHAAHASAIAQSAAKGGASGTALAAMVPLDPITMGIGLAAALVALLHLPPDPTVDRTPLRVFALVLASGFLAGVFVPVAVAGSTHYLPWLASVPDRPLQLAAAAAIGAAPHLLPYLWRIYRQVKRGEA